MYSYCRATSGVLYIDDTLGHVFCKVQQLLYVVCNQFIDIGFPLSICILYPTEHGEDEDDQGKTIVDQSVYQT